MPTTVQVAASGGPFKLPPIPTTEAVRPPVALLRCSAPGSGAGRSFTETFGHFEAGGSSPITRYFIFYGDGYHYSASTPDQVYEHTYNSPGTFHAVIIVTNAQGLTASSACDVTYTSTGGGNGGGAGQVPTGPTIPYPENGGGPTQCRDGSVSNSSGSGTCSHHGGEA